ncbi:probable LRR receptor-like serine/threonine-protein kinase At3g47570 [Phragmites australis]|uniref:probable LRR receptor-like serine/threonine-protein kinase At3g47570 n=1 Tax=Phragmites australis TaxID=29695 RepID=UPI002D78B506|nr:probable LRR receptor-like serine/threonine-protein kinase At3g47570 [Phragmites australis]
MLNLCHNNLSGPMPTCLNDLESLTKLDLSYNNFHGEIPNGGIFDNATIFSLDGNRGLCGGAMDLHMPPCHVVCRRKVEIVNYMVKILIPIFGFMLLIVFIYIIIPGNKTSRGPYLLLLSFGKQFPKVSYKDLAQATGNFSESNLIGRGSYGSVYKGNLIQAKMQVAIKVFDLEMRYGDKSFVSECEVLRRIRHRNLLSILSACSTIDNTEYAQSIHASTCGDVYSFGIVLLEIIIGKRPTDSMFEDELTMVSFVERNFPDKLLHIIDVHLREECKGFIQAAVESKKLFPFLPSD